MRKQPCEMKYCAEAAIIFPATPGSVTASISSARIKVFVPGLI